ncbi:ABC transporter ATP-binding protein [Halodesulfovibrio marinisediminis]|uniref:Putative ABC transport system ATP-binding protein n=1 Tax=Halodesulfovibrio marinisediminis DSM 17456 TaxID=1121457 RepID=A0A1N6IGS4_9BACT|nr:ABC transporter ATP-binding protein [Halodesulfovibrio marinisediminis]SIO31234.1 putative ABC transport system ATP-binding protein [Halodesulfovibrio marinisediminis DSM 17456]
MHSSLPDTHKNNHNDTPVLEFANVSFAWPGGAGLHNVSFAVPKGQFVLISGPSGSGKSTLLRLVVRLEEAKEGQILLHGTPITNFYPPLLRTHIGFVQQQPTLVAGSVRENLLFPFSLHSRKTCNQPEEESLIHWLNRLALNNISLDDPAETLSIGQQQRLCFIRAVLTKPDVICLDEPTSALDRESRQCVEHAAEELAQQGTAIMMVNHTSYHPTCPHMHLSVANGIVSVS